MEVDGTVEGLEPVTNGRVYLAVYFEEKPVPGLYKALFDGFDSGVSDGKDFKCLLSQLNAADYYLAYSHLSNFWLKTTMPNYQQRVEEKLEDTIIERMSQI